MNQIKMMLMRNKPTMRELVQPRTSMSDDAKTVFLVSFDEARKDQNKIMRMAKRISK